MTRQLHENAAGAALMLMVFLLATACGSEASESAVRNCGLLTSEEASELAGFALEAGEDTPIGCPYTRPGQLTAQMIVGTAALDESLRSRAERGYPQAADIYEVGPEGETLAILTPTGSTVAAIVAAREGRFVELGVFMLGIEPQDTDRIRSAASYAAKALDRAID